MFREMISTLPLFSSLTGAQINALMNLGGSRRYEKGEFITHYSETWPYLLLVASGSIHALKESSEGRSLLVASFTPGDVFWGLAFFDEGAMMPVYLQAVEKSEIYLWHRDRLTPFLLEHGRVSWELSRLMVKRMHRASEIVDELAFQPVTGRVARLLLENFPAEQGSVPRHLTLDEMAARVGTTREMVCRVLYRFEERGAIRINRTEFVFTNRGILEEQMRRN